MVRSWVEEGSMEVVAATREARLLYVYEEHPLRSQVRVVGLKWFGPSHYPVRVTWEHLRFVCDRQERFPLPTRIDCLPWPLRMVGGYSEMSLSALYVRTDCNGPAVWLYHLTASRLRRAWRWFFSRPVWTLVVWGLASIERGTRPTWGDVLRPQRESALALRITQNLTTMKERLMFYVRGNRRG